MLVVVLNFSARVSRVLEIAVMSCWQVLCDVSGDVRMLEAPEQEGATP
jgi:hypothetical protein